MSENKSKGDLHFETELDLWVLIHPIGAQTDDWQEFDQGPGRFAIPDGFESCVRIKNIDDTILGQLVAEIAACPGVVCLNLAENRKITNTGLSRLAGLTHLKFLNLSSCDITDKGLVWLKNLSDLRSLNLSYCNRLSDAGLKHLRSISSLTFLDLQGCPRIKHAAIIKFIARRGLAIHD